MKLNLAPKKRTTKIKLQIKTERKLVMRLKEHHDTTSMIQYSFYYLFSTWTSNHWNFPRYKRRSKSPDRKERHVSDDRKTGPKHEEKKDGGRTSRHTSEVDKRDNRKDEKSVDKDKRGTVDDKHKRDRKTRSRSRDRRPRYPRFLYIFNFLCTSIHTPMTW